MKCNTNYIMDNNYDGFLYLEDHSIVVIPQYKNSIIDNNNELYIKNNTKFSQFVIKIIVIIIILRYFYPH